MSRSIYIPVQCKDCLKVFSKRKDTIKDWSGLCLKCSYVQRKKFAEDNHFFGKFHSKDTKAKISKSRKGVPAWNKGVKCSDISERQRGLKNHQWISDRSKVVDVRCHKDYGYKQWHKKVLRRDNYVCRVADNNCEGRLEVHHILRWADHVELRYQTNNGITLCHAHHPFRKSEEKRLITIFQDIVSMSVSK